MFPVYLHRRPKVYWGSNIGSAYARVSRTGNYIVIRPGYKQQDLREFVDTLRHELAHLVAPGGHNQDFMRVLEKIGGTRYATSFKKLKNNGPKDNT